MATLKSNVFIEKHKADFEKSMAHFKKELHDLRSGRASATMVENIQVEAYGSFMPISQMGSISIPEPQAIMIDPWDKTLLKEIEKAMSQHPAGFSVVNTGERIIARVPLMTEENRKEVVKVLGKRAEEARVGIRKVRDTIKESIVTAHKDGDITEDDRYEYLANLDNYVTEFNKQIQELTEAKETEIMTI